MKRGVLLLVLVCAVLTIGWAQEPTGFLGDMLGQLEYVQGQVMQLEDAMPQSKMSWRPAKGVRSVSEVYLHIAFANYLLAKFAGIPLPEGLGVSSPSDADKWDKSTTNKKEIAERMKKSFNFLKDAIKAMPDADLEKQVTFFGQQMTVRGMLLTTLSHIHEHMGQSIAYARMNGIAPPWTAAQEAAMKEKKN